MSRVGRQAIPLPAGVTLPVDGSGVSCQGPKGTLQQRLPSEVQVKIAEGECRVERSSDERRHRAMHGLARTLVANMVTGVTEGYVKTLEIQGVGYRAQLKGKDLELALGFSHTVSVQAPQGITFGVERNVLVSVSGIDKQLVGEVAARIRRVRPPEPYKGKGVRYQGEQVRLKPGKTGA